MILARKMPFSALVAYACTVRFRAGESFFWASVPCQSSRDDPFLVRGFLRSSNGCASRNLEVGQQQPFNWPHHCFCARPRLVRVDWFQRTRAALPKPASALLMQHATLPGSRPSLPSPPPPPMFTQRSRHLISRRGFANRAPPTIEGFASTDID